ERRHPREGWCPSEHGLRRGSCEAAGSRERAGTAGHTRERAALGRNKNGAIADRRQRGRRRYRDLPQTRGRHLNESASRSAAIQMAGGPVTPQSPNNEVLTRLRFAALAAEEDITDAVATRLDRDTAVRGHRVRARVDGAIEESRGR